MAKKNQNDVVTKWRESRVKSWEFFKDAIEKTYNGAFIQFAIKTIFTDSIAVYPSELASDLFIELVDDNLNPFEDRVLYKWKHHDFVDEEYQKVFGNGPEYYLIPINQLIVLSNYVNPIEELDDDFALEDDDFNCGGENLSFGFSDTIINDVFDVKKDPKTKTDLDFSKATVRDVYAILHNKPVSNKSWINEMIKSNGKK